jgi:hypothetical protein
VSANLASLSPGHPKQDINNSKVEQREPEAAISRGRCGYGELTERVPGSVKSEQFEQSYFPSDRYAPSGVVIESCSFDASRIISKLWGLALTIRGRAMRRFALTCAAVAISAAWATAAAQNNPDQSSTRPAGDPQTTGQAESRRQAPIGHRQPTPKDLPPGLDQNRGARSSDDEALDRKLKICRAC